MNAMQAKKENIIVACIIYIYFLFLHLVKQTNGKENIYLNDSSWLEKEIREKLMILMEWWYYHWSCKWNLSHKDENEKK